MLQLSGLTKRFKSGNYGIRDLSLELGSGVLGLLGPNGAGKTTLMQMIAGLLKPTAGEIRFGGVSVLEDPDYLRRRLGYLPQDFGVYERLTAVEFLTYLAGLKGVRSRQRVREMLERLNLHAVADRQLGGLSGGMKQRLGIAQALINEPELVIVDEPTAGLDPEERVRLRNLLTGISEGRLVILSTHIVSDIESSATRIAVLHQGRLVAHDTPEALLRAAAGSVWEAVLPSSRFERLGPGIAVSRAARREDGVHARMVAAEAPIPDARSVAPTLEEAYLHLIGSQNGPTPAASGDG